MGAITGCCSATVLLPSEVVKAKTQVVVGNTGASSADIYKKMMKRQGMLGWVAAMPFDVPKTNVQASWESKVVGSYFPELIRIAKERGVLALYTGLIPTIARAFPANAALFLGVEMGKNQPVYVFLFTYQREGVKNRFPRRYQRQRANNFYCPKEAPKTSIMVLKIPLVS
eukprot:scaffold4398_cov250-Skeletonema_menzelii.AAC.1